MTACDHGSDRAAAEQVEPPSCFRPADQGANPAALSLARAARSSVSQRCLTSGWTRSHPGRG